MSARSQQAESVLMPHAARAPRLIVCESTGRWAVELKRIDLRPLGEAVLETRSLADAMAELTRSPASFFVAELHPEYAESLARLLVEARRRFPLARFGVVADRALARYEGWMLEAGAVCFAAGIRSLGPLTHAARRHLAAAPRPAQSLTERVWASLPWQDVANR